MDPKQHSDRTVIDSLQRKRPWLKDVDIKGSIHSWSLTRPSIYDSRLFVFHATVSVSYTFLVVLSKYCGDGVQVDSANGLGNAGRSGKHKPFHDLWNVWSLKLGGWIRCPVKNFIHYSMDFSPIRPVLPLSPSGLCAALLSVSFLAHVMGISRDSHVGHEVLATLAQKRLMFANFSLKHHTLLELENAYCRSIHTLHCRGWSSFILY